MNLNELKDVAFVMDTSPEKELFIADSGASVHLTGSLEGMKNLRYLKDNSVTVRDGNYIVDEKIGDKRITVIQ